MILASMALVALSIQVKILFKSFCTSEIVFFRSLIHLLILAPVLIFSRVNLLREINRLVLFRGVLGYLGVYCLFFSLRQMPAGFAILLAWTAPLFTVVASSVWNKERVPRIAIASILLALFGLLEFLVRRPGELTTRIVGDFAVAPHLVVIALLGAMSAGVSYAVLKRTGPGASPHAVAFYFSLVALLISVPGTLMGFQWPKWHSALPLVAAGVAASVYQYCVARAYQLAPVSRVAPLGLLTPLFGGLCDWAYFGQAFVAHQILGAALMVLGIALVNLETRGVMSKVIIKYKVILFIIGISSVWAKGDSPSERGRYLVNAIGCTDCHTPQIMTTSGPVADPARLFSGHPEDLSVPEPPKASGPWIVGASATNTARYGPWGVSFTANLTPDLETGIGTWTCTTFTATIRRGRHMGKGRPLLPPMPWQAYANFNDEDLCAIFKYLQTLPPIHNRVPSPREPR